MSFTITKIAPNNFTHFDGFKEMNFSNWEINFNNTTNTIVLQLRNGAPFPKREVLASEVIIKDGISGTPETFSTTEQIRTRLLALNYNPLQSSGSGGGAVDSVNGQTGVVVLDADDVGAVPLSGTTAGNPIAGDLDFSINSKLIFKDLDNNPFIKIGYNPDTDETGIWYDNGVDLPLRFSILSNGIYFYIGSNSIVFSENQGIIGSTDFSPNITDLDYTQKKYVDSLFGTLTGIFYGSAQPTDNPTGLEVGYWIATEAGTYTNFGGVVVNANSIAVISRDILGNFTISQTEIELGDYAKKDELLNLIQYDWLPATGFIGNDGVYYPAGFAKVTDYIDLTFASYISGIASWNETVKVFSFFDEDKVFISSLDGQKILKEDFPINAKFVRYTTTNTETLKITIANEELAVVKDNISSIETNLAALENDLIKYEDVAQVDGFIDASGNLSTSSLGKRSEFLPVEIGTRIIYTGKVTNTTLSIAAYDEDKVFIESVLQSEAGVTNQEIKIVVPSYKFVVVSGIVGLGVVFSAKISLDILSVKNELEAKIYGNDKIVALSEYIFPAGKNTTIYTNQLKTSDDSKFICLGANTFSNMYLTKKTLQSFVTSPSNASGNVKFQLLKNGTYVDEKNVLLRSVPINIGDGRDIRIVVSGDSLVDGKETACELFRLLNLDADYTIKQIGTKTTSMDGTPYKEEGRGAWDWAAYINPVYETTPYAGKTNPFFQSGALNFTNYLSEHFPSETGIDIFIMLLGTNDVVQGGAVLTDSQIADIIVRAKTFIDAFFDAFPDGHFVVGLPSIGADIGGMTSQNIERFREYIQKLNLLYISNFDDGNYHPNVHCVHYGSGVNTINSYNINNIAIDDYLPGITNTLCYDNIHPVTVGYKQFGRAVYNKVRGLLNDHFV